MVETKRRKNESFESMHRRFSRRVQLSGRILQKRKYRFFEKDLCDNALKASALRRKAIREKREYLMKIGKLVEKKRRGRRR